MSLTLDSTLQTQLDGTTRHPIVKITSEPFASPIPFEGNNFGYTESSDHDPDLTRLSDGRLAMVSDSNDSDGIIRLFVTDSTRSYWNSYDIQTNHTSYGIGRNSICEMTDGNLLIAFYYSLTTEYIRTWICTPEGENVSSSSNAVVSLSSSYDLYEHHVMYDSDAALYYIFYSYKTISGPTYTLAYRSSSDGVTWGGENVISLTGISSSNIIRNVHAMQASDDDIIISFQYEYDTDDVSGWTTYNTFYAASQDNCSTWSTPTQVTSYTAFGESSEFPQVEITDGGTVYFTYSDKVGVIYFDDTTTSVLSDISDLQPVQLHFYNDWIYCVSIHSYAGIKELGGMYVIDKTDMSLVTQYTQTTSPGVTAAYWSAEHAHTTRVHGAGKYMVAASRITGSSNKGVIAVATYDGVTDKVIEYIFNEDIPGYGMTANITATAHGSGASPFQVMGATVDADNDRLYVLLGNNDIYSYGIQIGYIDLTELADGEGNYTWNELYYNDDSTLMTAYDLDYSNYFSDLAWSEFRYCPNNDVLFFSSYFTSQHGLFIVFDAQTGVIQACKAYENDSRIPRHFVKGAVYDSVVYGYFVYTSGYSQSSYYGLFSWDMITDAVRYDRPGYIEQDNYYFYDMDFSDMSNGYIWMASYDGSVRYNIATHYFELFDGDSVPGYGGPGTGNADITFSITRDSSTGDIFAGSVYSVTTNWEGIRKFNPNGAYEIGQYVTGTKSGTSLGLGSASDLTISTNETQIAIVSDEDNILWAFWDHENILDSTYDFMWNRNLGSYVLSDDLVEGSAVEITWDVEYPSTLTFSCANGHLYDPINSLSSLNTILERGRKITVQFGENISDTEYWQNQGTFIVEGVELSYKRGEMPVINVQCCDLKRLWQEHRVVMTDYYNQQLPDVVMDDLLDNWTVLTGADYNISSFANEHTLWIQYADLSFWEILENILNHFGYIGYFDVDGVFVNKQIDFDKAVDHTYSDSTHIESFSPQSEYGGFINEVRVIGETRNEIEVLYEAEQVASRNGTMGWWCETEEVTIYYSEDRTRVGRNPYLDVGISLGDFQFFIVKGGGREYISEVDDTHKYCVVTLDGPNLIGVVVALAITTIAIGFAALWCTAYCGPYIYALSIVTNLLIYALCATANYSFTVWVQPIGYVRETVQYVASDTTMQDALNGQTITEEIEDPLCYGVDQCQMVAEHEMEVAKYQRNRIKFRKLAHLQDEIADKLTVTHPFSGQSMDVLVMNLKRTLIIGGEMMDDIEGWRII